MSSEISLLDIRIYPDITIILSQNKLAQYVSWCTMLCCTFNMTENYTLKKKMMVVLSLIKTTKNIKLNT